MSEQHGPQPQRLDARHQNQPGIGKVQPSVHRRRKQHGKATRGPGKVRNERGMASVHPTNSYHRFAAAAAARLGNHMRHVTGWRELERGASKRGRGQATCSCSSVRPSVRPSPYLFAINDQIANSPQFQNSKGSSYQACWHGARHATRTRGSAGVAGRARPRGPGPCGASYATTAHRTTCPAPSEQWSTHAGSQRTALV